MLGCSSSDDAALVFVEDAEQRRPEVDRPDPVVCFLQTDALATEHLADEQVLALPLDAPVRSNTANDQMPLVLDCWHAVGHLPSRGCVVRSWRLAIQSAVRTFLVVFADEAVETPLLRCQVG